MTQRDEILQNCMAALENGQPLEEVLASLPPEAASLAPMIRLAAQVRQSPTPPFSPAAYQRQIGIVRAAASARPARRGLRLPPWPTSTRQFTFGMLAALAVVVLALGVGLILTGPVAAQSASLSNVTGMVEVAPAQGADWHFVSGSEHIGKGALIRTYSGSSATLIFYDGSRSAIGPDSDIT